MSRFEPIRFEGLDVPAAIPAELMRLIDQGLVDLSPWHLMDRQLVAARVGDLRKRYRQAHVPFARRQDNDDIACLDPARPGKVLLVHDFASEGSELRAEYPSFWDWFRTAVEDMIGFEP